MITGGGRGEAAAPGGAGGCPAVGGRVTGPGAPGAGEREIGAGVPRETEIGTMPGTVGR